MEDRYDIEDDAPYCDANFREIEIIAYIGEFRIVGVAHFGIVHGTSSRRASDYIRSFNDPRLTLSRVRIYNKATKELIDTAPFVLLNMDKVDFIYGRDEDACAETPRAVAEAEE